MLRSLLFLTYAVISSLAMFAALFWLILFGRRGAMFGAYLWSKNIILAARFICGIKYKVSGKIPKYPAIYASKHQSAWETAFLLSVINRPVFVLKRELLWIPFFGLFMYFAGFIGVNRGKGQRALKDMSKKVAASLGSGNSVIIFPEGTRSKPGTKPHYKAGIAALYANCPECPVIPVGLDSGKCWPRNGFRKKPGIIHVKFLPKMEKGLSKTEFMKKLEEVIESNS